MNNISCNVIRDLLPSYMDGIASEDSVQLVEAHLAVCTDCKKFKDRMEKPDLHIADEDVSLDYMKKIRKLTDLKSAVCFFLVLITGVCFLEYTKNLHQSKPFFILVAVMLVCNYFLFYHNNIKKTAGKINAVIPNAASILLTLYIMLVMQWSFYNWMNNKNTPFNIDYADLGPFLHSQMMLTMAIEIIIWIWVLVLHIRSAQYSIVSSSFSIIGFYMSLYYDRMLKSIETLDSFHGINDKAFLLFSEGIGVLLLLVIIEKVKNRK